MNLHNEIIIIHLWSLEENTFKYISFRQKLEFEDLLDSYEGNLSKQNSISSDTSLDEDWDKKNYVIFNSIILYLILNY